MKKIIFSFYCSFYDLQTLLGNRNFYPEMGAIGFLAIGPTMNMVTLLILFPKIDIRLGTTLVIGVFASVSVYFINNIIRKNLHPEIYSAYAQSKHKNIIKIIAYAYLIFSIGVEIALNSPESSQKN